MVRVVCHVLACTLTLGLNHMAASTRVDAGYANAKADDLHLIEDAVLLLLRNILQASLSRGRLRSARFSLRTLPRIAGTGTILTEGAENRWPELGRCGDFVSGLFRPPPQPRRFRALRNALQARRKDYLLQSLGIKCRLVWLYHGRQKPSLIH